MATTEERLMQLKKEIQQAKIDKAQEEGALQQTMARLKEEFQVRSIDQAKIKLKRLQDQKEELQRKFDDAVAHLEEKYQW